MNYRRLGTSGLKVSEVCLGSWLTFGNATAEEATFSCVDAAFEAGINFFDTANVYATGKSEEVLGRALARYERDDFVLATKCFFPMDDGPNDRGLSRKHIREQCDRSLKRLGVDYVDLYQCHRYDPETPVEETLRALDDLVNAGKVLYVGFSMWSATQIADALSIQDRLGLDRFVSSQPYYNLLGRDIEPEVVPTCWNAGIGQIVFSPLAQGVLTGKYLPGQQPPADSRMADPRANMFLTGDRVSNDTLTKVQNLKPIAEREGLSMAQLALAWCLRRREISSVIIGATRAQQVHENAAASGKKLSDESLAEIDQVIGVHPSAYSRA
jgi:aryl-alcohol dehydrogenase-like predicted oxidoreductase